MAVLVLCLFTALAAGLVAIYARLAPLQALHDERTARQGMHEGKEKAVATEGEDLLKGHRGLIKELTETLYLERGIANERQGRLDVERAASHALVAQLNEERLVVEGICLELNAERVNLQEALNRALGRDRVDRAVEEIRARRARGESTSAQTVKHPAGAEEEEPTREGPPTRPATPGREYGARGQKEPVPSEEPVAPAEEEPRQSARPTTLPTTPEALAQQRELVTTTAAVDMDPDGDEATRAMSSSAVAQALHAAAGDADEGDNDPTLSLSRDAMDEALGADAGGTTRAPQTPPRAVGAVAVAPPASAPPRLFPEPARRAAGLLGRGTNAPVATPPAPPRSGTLVGMPRVSAPAPADGGPEEGVSSPTAGPGGMVHSIHTRGGHAPRVAAPRATKALLSMSAQSVAWTASPSDAAAPPPDPDDHFATFASLPLVDPEHTRSGGEPPWTPTLDPPLYAPRGRSTEETQRGRDGVPETVRGRRLEPHEETPPRPRGGEHEARK